MATKKHEALKTRLDQLRQDAIREKAGRDGGVVILRDGDGEFSPESDYMVDDDIVDQILKDKEFYLQASGPQGFYTGHFPVKVSCTPSRCKLTAHVKHDSGLNESFDFLMRRLNLEEDAYLIDTCDLWMREYWPSGSPQLQQEAFNMCTKALADHRDRHGPLFNEKQVAKHIKAVIEEQWKGFLDDFRIDPPDRRDY